MSSKLRTQFSRHLCLPLNRVLCGNAQVMTKFLLALTFPVSGLVISGAAVFLYIRIRRTGALISAMGFGLTSLTWIFSTIAGTVINNNDPFSDNLVLIFQISQALAVSGAVIAAIGMVMLASQLKE